jgi:hypothetical protein
VRWALPLAGAWVLRMSQGLGSSLQKVFVAFDGAATFADMMWLDLCLTCCSCSLFSNHSAICKDVSVRCRSVCTTGSTWMMVMSGADSSSLFGRPSVSRCIASTTTGCSRQDMIRTIHVSSDGCCWCYNIFDLAGQHH